MNAAQIAVACENMHVGGVQRGYRNSQNLFCQADDAEQHSFRQQMVGQQGDAMR